MPWLSEEKDLLIHLRRDRGLPWWGVTRIFSEQIPRKKSGIHASVLEPESQERLLAILSLLWTASCNMCSKWLFTTLGSLLSCICYVHWTGFVKIQ